MEKQQKTVLLQHRQTPDWIDRLDAWRHARAVQEKRDISRSEAVRQLVESAL